MRYSLLLAIAAAVALLSACGGTSPPGSTIPAPSLPAPASTVPVVQLSPAQSATGETNCALGYADGSQTFADTADGYAAAQQAANGSEPHMVAQVTITNSGSQGVDLTSYVIEYDDPSIPETIQIPYTASATLAPGQSWDYVQDLGTPGHAAGGLSFTTETTLQLFTCHVKSWQ